jgi:hypothetical protein
MFRHGRFQFLFAIEVQRAMEENHLRVVRAREGECVAHGFSGMGRQVSGTKNAFDINHL